MGRPRVLCAITRDERPRLCIPIASRAYVKKKARRSLDQIRPTRCVAVSASNILPWEWPWGVGRKGYM
jgi:hypothetical protein